MELPPADYCNDTATNDILVNHLSRSNPRRIVLHELEGGIAVVRISDKAVVKYGFGVWEKEAKNQQRAFELIDQRIVRIPRVYRFFSVGHSGYLIMEYISGQTLDTLIRESGDSDLYIPKMVAVMEHLTQIQSELPGPLHPGFAKGFLWLDYDPVVPAQTSVIEEYYNKRQLRKSENKLQISEFPLVLCHLDIAPRNIIVHKDTLCLIDWASAGFYPIFFERCTLKINSRRLNDWNNKLLSILPALSEAEESQAELLERAFYLGQKYQYSIKKLTLVPPSGPVAPLLPPISPPLMSSLPLH